MVEKSNQRYKLNRLLTFARQHWAHNQDLPSLSELYLLFSEKWIYYLLKRG